MREQFGVIGLGACGSNIANLFEAKGYNSLYINTSIEDLNVFKGTHKLHIKGAEGAAKDRKRVLQLATETFPDIIQQVENIITQKYIVVIFSSAGGTGSGLSIPILRYLSQTGKVCIPVMVLPDGDAESTKANENAYNACAELMSIQGLGATFLLDNSKYDKFAINSRFVNELDTFINLKNSSMYGNIDMAERKQVLSCPGVAMIAKTSKAKSSAADIIYSLHNGTYVDMEQKTAMYLALSTSNKSLDIKSITSELHSLYDQFIGYSEATSLMVISGLQWPMKRIEAFKNKFEETVQNINNTINHHVPTIQPLQGLSFMERQTAQPTTSVNPRDILLGLLNN
jgi:cell division GTPase FtsZ